ncbi:hypothetical protein [Streptomyces sp. NPDC088360]|uniref:hypothetical protein n=1 Tax=Streptomyces sp. NPDC088360 TaxID=3154515 RepID=UPI00344CECBF
MYIRGVSPSDFRELTADVSSDRYETNVIVAPGAHVARNRATVARLRVADSRGFGARTAASGRHGPYACWHAYRDVLFLLFCTYPAATVRTCCATYRGIQGFEENFQITEYHNLGSALHPRYLRDLCVMARCGDPPDIWDMPWPTPADDIAARTSSEIEQAVDAVPDVGFTGPPSLQGAPDLAYSHVR